MGKYEVEPAYGGAVEAAHKALNQPQQFHDCVSVIFDKGGEDGYWIRLLGNENVSDRRVGSLLVTPDAIAYAEMHALKPRPSSSLGKIRMMTRGGSRAFGFFVWTATSHEIDDLVVKPLVASPHGSHASVEITARGDRLRFGIDLGRPDAQQVVSAIRHVSRREHDLGTSHGLPRTDGVYVFAAHSRPQRFHVVRFDDEFAQYLRMTDVAKDLGDLDSGKWSPEGKKHRVEDGHFVVSSEDPEWDRHALVQESGGLVLVADKWRREPDDLGSHTWEFEFVPRSDIGQDWGRPTIAPPLPAPDWPAIRTESGDLVAAELGHPPVRVKG